MDDKDRALYFLSYNLRATCNLYESALARVRTFWLLAGCATLMFRILCILVDLGALLRFFFPVFASRTETQKQVLDVECRAGVAHQLLWSMLLDKSFPLCSKPFTLCFLFLVAVIVLRKLWHRRIQRQNAD